MKAILIISLVALSFPAQADVFKCTDPQTKRSLYQTEPCADAAVEQRLEVERRSAEEEAAAAERLRIWQARLAEEEALKAEIAKELWEAQLKATEVEAARRNAAAPKERARAQHRQADEMSRPPLAITVPAPDAMQQLPSMNWDRRNTDRTLR